MVAAPWLVSEIWPSRGPSAIQPSFPAYPSALTSSWPSKPISQASFLIHAFAIGAEYLPAAIKASRSRIAFSRSIARQRFGATQSLRSQVPQYDYLHGGHSP